MRSLRSVGAVRSRVFIFSKSWWICLPSAANLSATAWSRNLTWVGSPPSVKKFDPCAAMYPCLHNQMGSIARVNPTRLKTTMRAAWFGDGLAPAVWPAGPGGPGPSAAVDAALDFGSGLPQMRQASQLAGTLVLHLGQREALMAGDYLASLFARTIFRLSICWLLRL